MLVLAVHDVLSRGHALDRVLKDLPDGLSGYSVQRIPRPDMDHVLRWEHIALSRLRVDVSIVELALVAEDPDVIHVDRHAV